MDDDKVFRGDPKISKERDDGFSAQVHEGHGLRHDNLSSPDRSLAYPGIELPSGDLKGVNHREPIKDEKAHIVPRSPVLSAGIAKAYDEVHGFFSPSPLP